MKLLAVQATKPTSSPDGQSAARLNPAGMINPLLALSGMVMLLVQPLPVNATPICRWTDDSGKTQIAETVPLRFAKVATCVDSERYELSKTDRQAAETQAAKDSAMARRQAVGSTAKSASGADAPSGAPEPQPETKRPATVVTDATDCGTWWRLYDESAECFGPYRTTRGATRVEAFDHCNVVPSPEPKCGPRRY